MTVPIRISTGVDVIAIHRIDAAAKKWGDRFLCRVYTEGERLHCRGRPEKLAGRFAAKEAVSKALGVGIRGLGWRDIEVLPDRRGKPHVYLHGKAAAIAQRVGLSKFDVSITHSRTDAIAFVVAWAWEAEK